MTTTLNPKLLDFVVAPSTGEGSLKPLSGTVVEVYGPDSVLVEVSDENGVARDFVTVPAHDAKVVWESVSRKPAQESGKDAQTLLEEGVLLLQNGLPASARNRFAKSFGLDPNCARILLNSTLELAKKGAFDSALFILRLIVELKPGYQLARENSR